MKFSIKDAFSKCNQVRSFVWIWSHLLKKSLMENFIFCPVFFSALEKKGWYFHIDMNILFQDYTLMKLQIVICITCYFLVTETLNPSRKNGTRVNTNINMDIQVRRFSKLIKNFKKSIFHKSKRFKWGCGGKCDIQRRMRNVIQESRNPYEVEIQNNDTSKERKKNVIMPKATLTSQKPKNLFKSKVLRFGPFKSFSSLMK